MDDGDFDKSRRNSLMMSLAIILFFIGNGSIGDSATASPTISILGGTLSIDRTAFFITIWVIWAWLLWRYSLFSAYKNYDFPKLLIKSIEHNQKFKKLALSYFEKSTPPYSTESHGKINLNKGETFALIKDLHISVTYGARGDLNIFEKGHANAAFRHNGAPVTIEIGILKIFWLAIWLSIRLIIRNDTFSTVLFPYIAALFAGLLGISHLLKSAFHYYF